MPKTIKTYCPAKAGLNDWEPCPHIDLCCFSCEDSKNCTIKCNGGKPYPECLARTEEMEYLMLKIEGRFFWAKGNLMRERIISRRKPLRSFGEKC